MNEHFRSIVTLTGLLQSAAAAPESQTHNYSAAKSSSVISALALPKRARNLLQLPLKRNITTVDSAPPSPASTTMMYKSCKLEFCKKAALRPPGLKSASNSQAATVRWPSYQDGDPCRSTWNPKFTTSGGYLLVNNL